MPLLVVYNPVCGHGTGESYFSSTVLPLLNEKGISPDQVVSTARVGHGGELVLEFLRSQNQLPGVRRVTIILGSGDGTLYEIVNALYSTSDRVTAHRTIELVLVPCGTANALYASLIPPRNIDGQGLDEEIASDEYKLRALNAYLDASAPPSKELIVARTSIEPPSDSSDTAQTFKRAVGEHYYSAVVTSTSLHALIVRDAEELRAAVPGIERFKQAAAKNIDRHVKAKAILSGSRLERYEPGVDDFIPVDGRSELTLEGPFAYFLAVTGVDRLESAFRIAPLRRSIPSGSDAHTVDIVVVRPERDPEFDPSAFAGKLARVLAGAYEDGAHIKFRYDVAEGAIGECIVEYYRCERWEWYPEVDDELAHVLCVDGCIFNVPKRGRVVSTVARDPTIDGPKFLLYE